MELQDVRIKTVEVPGDGNCLFYAVVQQLSGRKCFDSQFFNEAMRLRRRTVDYLMSHKTEMRDVILAEIITSSNVTTSNLSDRQLDEKIDQHLRNLAKCGTWAGGEALMAIKEIVGANIRIYNPHYQPLELVHGNGRCKTIEIYFNGINHYDSVELGPGGGQTVQGNEDRGKARHGSADLGVESRSKAQLKDELKRNEQGRVEMEIVGGYRAQMSKVRKIGVQESGDLILEMRNKDQLSVERDNIEQGSGNLEVVRGVKEQMNVEMRKVVQGGVALGLEKGKQEQLLAENDNTEQGTMELEEVRENQTQLNEERSTDEQGSRELGIRGEKETQLGEGRENVTQGDLGNMREIQAITKQHSLKIDQQSTKYFTLGDV
ncbi:OTU domain-containing protein 3-like [Aedes albopictus]|uniref:OTU domain-containing protein n=1 Tax=Aedes albopictus TaxID=7160 RepID=A0ABM1YGR5_AEDAL